MNVKQLINYLSKLDPEMEVMIWEEDGYVELLEGTLERGMLYPLSDIIYPVGHEWDMLAEIAEELSVNVRDEDEMQLLCYNHQEDFKETLFLRSY